MKYTVKMWDVGRNNASVEKTFDHEPDYSDLRGMVGSHLASSIVEFFTDAEQLPITDGRIVVGGFRPVGNFSIEVQGAEGTA